MIGLVSCTGCDFVTADIIADGQHCIYCSSKDITVQQKENLVQSRESLLMQLAFAKFGKQYSCLSQMSGENGFNPSEIVDKIKDEQIWKNVNNAQTLDELLTIVGKPSEEQRRRRPCVCPPMQGPGCSGALPDPPM